MAQESEKTPSGMRIIWREIVRDKVALISLIFIILIMAVCIWYCNFFKAI